MKRSLKLLSMVIDRYILNYNQITLFHCFIFIPKISMGRLKTGVSFYCA